MLIPGFIGLTTYTYTCTYTWSGLLIPDPYWSEDLCLYLYLVRIGLKAYTLEVTGVWVLEVQLFSFLNIIWQLTVNYIIIIIVLILIL